jgi:hypothetical protein
MIDLLSENSCSLHSVNSVKNSSPLHSVNSPHYEALAILTDFLTISQNQIRQFDSGDFKDRSARAAKLRKRCKNIETSINLLKGAKS